MLLFLMFLLLVLGFFLVYISSDRDTSLISIWGSLFILFSSFILGVVLMGYLIKDSLIQSGKIEWQVSKQGEKSLVLKDSSLVETYKIIVN